MGGIGRTGTFLAIDHGIEHLQSKNRENTLETIKTLRQDRCALVQHPKQYQFVHTALTNWAASKHKNLKSDKPKTKKKKGDPKSELSVADAKIMRAAEKSSARQ